jgi:hypothetical protein
MLRSKRSAGEVALEEPLRLTDNIKSGDFGHVNLQKIGKVLPPRPGLKTVRQWQSMILGINYFLFLMIFSAM